MKHDPLFEAFPPEKAALSYGLMDKNSPFKSKNFSKINIALKRGYTPKPSDCPPLRFTSRYGFVARSPGDVIVEKYISGSDVKVFSDDFSSNGIMKISGDRLNQSDSGFVASWITGSHYFKIQTNIIIFFPSKYNLMQGHVPNPLLTPEVKIKNTMLGIEYGKNQRSIKIRGEDYFKADLNFISPLPDEGSRVVIGKGDVVGWFVPVLRKNDLQINELKIEDFSET